MRRRRFAPTPLALALTLVMLTPSKGSAAVEECRLLRQPDIQGGRIVFVYAGDLWTVAREGGVASRLTSHEGIEQFPKFSPDGKTIAFTGEYDGNVDVFTVPAEGGEPVRLTWHPDGDQVAAWYPDGKSILFRSRRASFSRRYDRFFKIPAAGGFEQALALPSGGYASFSPDGGQIAYLWPTYDNRTWKRYKGGNAPDVWIYDFAKNTSERITDWPGADEWPMWHGRTIYYASDRGGRTTNIWAYDLERKTHRQVTDFKEYDVRWPSVGGDSIVFENGGFLYVMDLPGEKAVKIQVLVPDDRPAARAEYRNVAAWTTAWDLSPSAKRAVFEARGDLFTVPAEKGDVRLLTEGSAARERGPVWSPDGKWIAYLSDRSGEYEIHVAGSDGKTPERQVTKDGNTFRFDLQWSPDSAKIAFSDKTLALWWCDVATGKLTKADTAVYGEIHGYQWSGDSRWLAYAKPDAAGLSQISLYSIESGKVTPFSDGMTDDSSPSFDPEGKYLYFISRRRINPTATGFELGIELAGTDKIYAASLRKDLPSPVAPESDEETGEAKPPKDDAAAKESKGPKEAKEEKPVAPVQIDLDGLATRVAEIPIPAGSYGQLEAFKGKLLFTAAGEPLLDGGPEAGQVAIHVFNFDKKEDKVVISGVQPPYAASKDGAKVLYHAKDLFGIVDAAEGKKSGDGKIEASTLMTIVTPPLEWMQMFNEAWRLERDFYYDPGMGGLDWKAVGERYRRLVPYVAHRDDLNYILGELIGELSTSHAYVGGGDAPHLPRVGVGLLGADYEMDARSGLYRFKSILRERDWNSDTPAPLGQPGVDVREGDYLLSVNGRKVSSSENLYAPFVGTAGKQTILTVGGAPDDPKPRTFTVKPIESEATLRYTAWVHANREKVSKATDGRVAYIHVPDTAVGGIQEFTKQYYPQAGKDGIIVDERFNSGGFIPSFFVERLRRTTWVYWATRDGAGFPTPQGAIDGPKCMLINQYAGSGGDAFPYFFRLNGLGPLIGERTWGGLVGISHSLPLVDGGVVTMPDFGMWDPRTKDWAVENHGVDPDVEIENRPEEMIAGRDPQLERAIQYVNDQLKAHPPLKPAHPKYKVQQ
jgi:tricorn protease